MLRTIGGTLGVGLSGAALGWELAYRLAQCRHKQGSTSRPPSGPRPTNCWTPDQLAIVQAQLGNTLRDVYLQDGRPGDRDDALCPLATQQARDPYRSRKAKEPTTTKKTKALAVAVSEM